MAVSFSNVFDQETISSSQDNDGKLPFAVPYPPLTTPPTTDDVTATPTTDDVTTTPHYIITHQGGVDLQDYTNNRSGRMWHVMLPFCWHKLIFAK